MFVFPGFSQMLNVMSHLPHVQKASHNLFSFLLISLLGLGNLGATHLVGGDFDYVHLGGDQYQITLKVYRDCSPANVNETPFDDQVAIGMWDGTGVITGADVVSIPLTFSNVTNVPVEMGNPCGTPPPELCIEQAVYTTTVTLPANAYGWDLVYQRCCRNPTIVNLDDFGGTENAGMTLDIHIPGTDITTESNSSPAFQELPPVALCSNLPFVWDHSAVDPDGDDLVYSLCAPLQGADAANAQPNPPSTPPYLPVPYLPGFTWDNPMTADPALAIDPQTGQLTCTPTVPGQYAIGICVEEYRDGTLLSTVRRDFQFNVTTCEPTEMVLEADAVPFAAGGLTSLVSYNDALGLPAVFTYPNGESFPMAAWIADNNTPVVVDGQTMVVDAVVIEGCNDARFTIFRPESEAALLDTTYLTLTGTASDGLDFSEDFYEVIMLADSISSDIELGLVDDNVDEGVEHLLIECEYVNACDQVSSTLARVVILDPLPIVPTPSALSCLDENGNQTLGYDNITGYGPFNYTWDGNEWNNASHPPSEWTVSFDSSFHFLDASGELQHETVVELVIEDQCGNVESHLIPVLHPVAIDAELCPLTDIPFPAFNDDIAVTDVLYGGVSILNDPESGVPLVAHASPEGNYWKLSGLEALDTPTAWEETLTLVDSCGFETQSLVRIRDCGIPNVFTPDNLGGNNVFRVRGLSGAMGSRLLVFNRYGTLIWSDETKLDSESQLVWDGNYPNGDPAPEGHYQWLLQRSNGVEEHGSLHLFRAP
jgi:gliding motility-associated-like protein